MKLNFRTFVLSIILAIILPCCIAFACFSYEFDNGTFWEIPSKYLIVNKVNALNDTKIEKNVTYKVLLNQSYLNKYKFRFIFSLGLSLSIYMLLWLFAVAYNKKIAGQR